jgi:hypothetical protein
MICAIFFLLLSLGRFESPCDLRFEGTCPDDSTYSEQWTSDFEEGNLDGFTASIPAITTASTDRAYEGSYSLKHNSSGLLSPYSYRTITVQDGEYYQISAWINTDTGVLGAVKLQVYKPVTGVIHEEDGPGSYDTWTKVIVGFTASEDASNYEVRLKSGQNQIVYFDFVEVKQLQ